MPCQGQKLMIFKTGQDCWDCLKTLYRGEEGAPSHRAIPETLTLQRLAGDLCGGSHARGRSEDLPRVFNGPAIACLCQKAWECFAFYSLGDVNVEVAGTNSKAGCPQPPGLKTLP